MQAGSVERRTYVQVVELRRCVCKQALEEGREGRHGKKRQANASSSGQEEVKVAAYRKRYRHNAENGVQKRIRYGRLQKAAGTTRRRVRRDKRVQGEGAEYAAFEVRKCMHGEAYRRRVGYKDVRTTQQDSGAPPHGGNKPAARPAGQDRR